MYRAKKARTVTRQQSSQPIGVNIHGGGQHIDDWSVSQARRLYRSRRSRARSRVASRLTLIVCLFLVAGTFVGLERSKSRHSSRSFFSSNSGRLIDESIEKKWPPLVMEGGDPYIRALMRTISASESNYSKPYHVLYGGEFLSDLSYHPDRCVEIVRGPNRGTCTTAAGRYQILSTTWEKLSERYHPNLPQFSPEAHYSFGPEYQDIVIYEWLLDKEFWDNDVARLLRRGKLDRVLDLLSGTWTSLGYGIEDNVMTDALPEVYERILHNELNYSNGSSWLAE
ncbi:MAG: glycoside hydrolase [Microcoleaceae cyanobacterium]